MCGRYYVAIDDDELRIIGEEAERIASSFAAPPDVKTSGEIFPTDIVPVQFGMERYAPMKWGFINFDRKMIINARSETALDKPMFKKPMLESRCLIPASGYYEWRRETADGGNDKASDKATGKDNDNENSGDKSSGKSKGKEKKTKFQFYIPGQLMYLAGCYRMEKDSPIAHFVILTRPAVNGLETFHDRMPVIIPKERIVAWMRDGHAAMESAVSELAYRASA